MHMLLDTCKADSTYIVISNEENSNMEFHIHAILFSSWSSEFVPAFS